MRSLFSGSRILNHALILMLAAGGCGPYAQEELHVPLTGQLGEPVGRDFNEIRRSRVIRMITEYGAGTYFIEEGNQTGFEYQLVRSFARQHNLALEVIIPGEGQDPYELLYSGAGDLIASQYSVSEEKSEIVAFTRPYSTESILFVFSPSMRVHPSSLDEVIEQGLAVSVRRNTAHYEELVKKREAGYGIQIDLLEDSMTPERVLNALSKGELDAAVVDDHMFNALKGNFPELVAGPVLSRGHHKAWAVRSNATDLKNEINRYLYRHYRASEDGDYISSTFLRVLRSHFFGSEGSIASLFRSSVIENNAIVASPFESLVRSVADSAQIDWMMVNAVISQESSFNPSSKSWAGAVGLMQVMPQYSRETYEDLYVPEINVREGVRILKEHYEHYSYLPDERTRWAFALATYNAGLGHMADARRLAIDMNKDPNNWEDVSDALLKLMQKQYNQHARYGYVRGIETVKYVNEVHNRFLTYQTILNGRNESEMLTQR